MPAKSYVPVPWTLPSSYMGAHHDGWLVFLSRNRDSVLLEEVNFDSALEELQELPEVEFEGENTVKVVHENHWACGWVEWIAIHPSNTAAVALATEIGEGLDDYPVVNDDAYSTASCDATYEVWAGMNLRERIAVIKEHAPGKSVLAARHNFIPSDGYDRLEEYVRGIAEG